MDTFENRISLGVSCCDHFGADSIILLHHFFELCHEFRATVEDDFLWPRISGEPSLFGQVGDSDCFLVGYPDHLEPSGSWVDHGKAEQLEILVVSFPFWLFNLVWSDEVDAQYFPRLDSADLSGRWPYLVVFLLVSWQMEHFLQTD